MHRNSLPANRNPHQFAIPDKPSKVDLLGVDGYARALADEIAAADHESTPWTIGIHGEWGSGKTTFLGLIEKHLKPSTIEPIWFNAWKYGREEDLWSALLHTVLAKIKVAGPWWRRPVVMARIWWHTVNLRAGGWEIAKRLLVLLLRLGAVGLALVLAANAIGSLQNPLTDAIVDLLRQLGLENAAQQNRWVQAAMALVLVLVAKPDSCGTCSTSVWASTSRSSAVLARSGSG